MKRQIGCRYIIFSQGKKNEKTKLGTDYNDVLAGKTKHKYSGIQVWQNICFFPRLTYTSL